MPNPWVAIDVSTSPSARAREVRLARERFLEDPRGVSGVRSPIVESWRRSAAVGVGPSHGTTTREPDERQALERFAEHPIGRLAPILHHSLAPLSGEAEHLVVVSDADGLLLSVDGDLRARHRAAESMSFAAGALWSEHAVGTNAIGVALATDHAVQVFAGEHYSERMQWWTCAAAPIHDPKSGRLLGTVNLTAPMETVHPHTLALVMATASALEAHLGLEARVEGKAAGLPVRRAPAADRSPALAFEVLGRDRADVRVDGREFALTQRHSEVLVLLAAHPAGMTGEQLAIALYGDEGKPVTARAEVSRLKRLLGPCIRTEPYRLEAELQCDITTLQQHLRDGHVAEAIDLHRGPLLPRSEAPGVVDLRNELEGWTRRTALASDDLEALWSWLGTPSGADDLHAWKRFLANVAHDDGRRGLAAARLERLRPLFGGTGQEVPTPVAAVR